MWTPIYEKKNGLVKMKLKYVELMQIISYAGESMQNIKYSLNQIITF